MDASKVVPTWVFNPESPHYASVQEGFPNQVRGLSRSDGARMFFVTSDDRELSVDVKRSLVPIFEIIVHTLHLADHMILRVNEADRRLAVDHLASHIWNYPRTDFIQKLECAVQLPVANNDDAEEARPDATVFFQLERSTLEGLSPQISRACSSVQPRLEFVYRYVLHWVIEYKGETHTDSSKRQTWMAMASGLYQRRSLGFKDHYVFGAAHHSKTSLTVYAGNWVDHADLPAAARSSEPTAKVVIYTLGTFNMASTIQMVQFYLLMRHTKSLALQYKAVIDDQAGSRVDLSPISIHDWPPTVKPKSTTGSGKRKNGGATPAAQDASGGSVPGTRMVASPDTDNHTSELVHIVGVDDPLIHRFAEELSENGESAKVRGYLMSSVHDNYDYQVGNS